jgi:hypothetical protein
MRSTLAAAAGAADSRPLFPQRWFYAAFNLLVGKNTDTLIELIGRPERLQRHGPGRLQAEHLGPHAEDLFPQRRARPKDRRRRRHRNHPCHLPRRLQRQPLGPRPQPRRWRAAARGVPGVSGFLYTTWEGNYSLLEAYGRALLGKE